MNKAVVLSITLVASIAIIPNVYAEEGGFFDWLMKLFGGFGENESPVETVTKEATKIKKAVIIDQLHNDIPNEAFQKNATEFLQNAGYEVDVYTTDDITVDFYKNLPSMNYDFIVVRSHSLAIYSDKPSSWIFTGEKYDAGRYTHEQLSGQLSPGIPFRQNQIAELAVDDAKEQRLFMIGSKFIEESMRGQFSGTQILLGGCDTMAHSFLGEAFVNRGASSIIGWNGLVDFRDNDKVMLKLLDEIFYENRDIENAVEKVVEDHKDKTYYGTKLLHFSSGASGSINS